VQQWDGKAWKVISGWYTANQETTEPLVKEVSAKYAADKHITPRDCAKGS
jgi:branched-chain amino acid transport system substrate-binding protein